MAAALEYQGARQLSATEIVGRYETQGWVKELPSLHDQAADTSRTNTFTYIGDTYAANGRDPLPGETTVTMTEHEGLKALEDYLAAAAKEDLTDEDGNDLSSLAAWLGENLNFIGEKEYQEAVVGMKALWQSCLDADPDLQLCIYDGVIEHDGNGRGRKSDQYLAERILGEFSEDELVAYGDRIVRNVAGITRPPEHTKIIIADDWSISGSQVHKAEFSIKHELQDPAYASSIEAHFIIAPEERLQNGMGFRMSGDDTPLLPVRAYHKAHAVSYSHDLLAFSDAPTTGAHSSVDHGFEHILEPIAQARGRNGEPDTLPPLANVVRAYRGNRYDAEGEINPEELGSLPEEEDDYFFVDD